LQGIINKNKEVKYKLKLTEVKMGTEEPANLEKPEKPNKNPKKRIFLSEIWTENRSVVKEIISHTVGFALLIGVLLAFHPVIERSPLPLDEKEILHKIDFYTTVISLIMFAARFVIKLLGIFVKGK
jgi:hypothetical protein